MWASLHRQPDVLTVRSGQTVLRAMQMTQISNNVYLLFIHREARFRLRIPCVCKVSNIKKLMWRRRVKVSIRLNIAQCYFVLCLLFIVHFITMCSFLPLGKFSIGLETPRARRRGGSECRDPALFITGGGSTPGNFAFFRFFFSNA